MCTFTLHNNEVKDLLKKFRIDELIKNGMSCDFVGMIVKKKQMQEKEFALKENEEFIELNNLLKILAVVSSGGEAKIRINNGEAIVNGEVDTRKRKKMRSGDIVEFGGYKITIKTKGNE